MTEPDPFIARNERKTAAQTFCCCCRRSSKCIAAIIFILILIGLTFYFLFPAVPTVQVGNLFIPPGTEGLTVTRSAGSSPSDTKLNIELAVASNISVYSSAYVNIGIRSITVDIFLKGSSGFKLPNVNAHGVYINLKVIERATTNFTFPANITYSVFAPNVLKDPVVVVLQETCLLVPQKKLSAHVIVTLDISAISWIGIYPKFQNDVAVDCPPIDSSLFHSALLSI